MRLRRAQFVPLLLVCAGRLFADEHNYSAFMGVSAAKSSTSWGLHLTYEDTTKRTDDRKKRLWSYVVDTSAYQDGPEVQYLVLAGGRRSWPVKEHLVVTGQALVGFASISGAETRIRLEALDKEARGEKPDDDVARQDGALFGAGVGFDFILKKQIQPKEDGPRLQFDLLYQVGDTPGWHVRASAGWVIRYR